MEGVEAIGQTGDPDEVPIPGFRDYDLFVLCSKIPSMEERISCYNRQEELFTELNMEVCKADIHWRTGDILLIDGVETMFMYFLCGRNEGLYKFGGGRQQDITGGRILSSRKAFHHEKYQCFS